jgi:glucosylglycerate hydrolase
MGPKNNRVVPTETDLGADVQLAVRARQVLRQNAMGDWTRAAPILYPHQWSWDSAFIAIGPAHFNTRRATKVLLALFGHQWGTGKVPHVGFNPEAPSGSYFPGPQHWAYAAASPVPRPRRPTPDVFVSPRSTPSPPCASGR